MAGKTKNIPEMIDYGLEPRYFVGNVVYEKGGRFGPRIQAHPQIVLFFNGESRVWQDAAVKTLRGGECFLMVPGSRYRIAFSERERVRHGWVDAFGAAVPVDIRKGFGSDIAVAPVSRRMRWIYDEAIGLAGPDGLDEQRLYRWLAEGVFEEFFYRLARAESRETLPGAVLLARQWIETHFPNPEIDLGTIAREAGVSKTHLVRLFREHVGSTPVRYLWEIRRREGVRLLEQSGLRINEVADRCGFKTPFHFSRLIRKATGRSPREIRRIFWAGGG